MDTTFHSLEDVIEFLNDFKSIFSECYNEKDFVKTTCNDDTVKMYLYLLNNEIIDFRNDDNKGMYISTTKDNEEDVNKMDYLAVSRSIINIFNSDRQSPGTVNENIKNNHLLQLIIRLKDLKIDNLLGYNIYYVKDNVIVTNPRNNDNNCPEKYLEEVLNTYIKLDKLMFYHTDFAEDINDSYHQIVRQIRIHFGIDIDKLNKLY